MRTLYVLRAVIGVIAASAFVAIWGGWVGLGGMAGFGPVNLLPGIGSGLTVDLSITLPLGVEAFAAIALYVAVSGIVTGGGRVFAWCSALGSLVIGAAGQVAYHLLTVAGQATATPTPVVVFVSVLPVAVLGLASVLLHLAERGHHRAVPVAVAATPAAVIRARVAVPATVWPVLPLPGATVLPVVAAAATRGPEDDPDPDTDLVPWSPDDGWGGDGFWQAVTAFEQGTAAGSGSRPPAASGGGRSVPRSLIPEGLRIDALPGERRRTAAHQVLLDTANPRRADLAARHGMSERWWGERIAEVRGSAAG